MRTRIASPQRRHLTRSALVVALITGGGCTCDRRAGLESASTQPPTRDDQATSAEEDRAPADDDRSAVVPGDDLHLPDGATPLLDWAHRVAGHIRPLPVERGTPRRYQVVPEVGPPFEIDYSLGGMVSRGGRRILMAGGQLDALVGARGGVALLFDEDRELVATLAEFQGGWMGPGPVYGIDAEGASWIAADGEVRRFDPAGRQTFRRPWDAGAYVSLLRLSPDGRHALLVLRDAGANWAGPVVMTSAGEFLSEASGFRPLTLPGLGAMAWMNCDIDFLDDDTFAVVHPRGWAVVDISPERLTAVHSGQHTGINVTTPFSVTAAADWFAYLVVDGERTFRSRAIDASSGAVFAESIIDSPQTISHGACPWRCLSLDTPGVIVASFRSHSERFAVERPDGGVPSPE